MNTYVLEKLSELYPNKIIQLSHQFLDGIEGKACGFVPNSTDGSTIIITGQWW